jgi:hypothetical protein
MDSSVESRLSSAGSSLPHQEDVKTGGFSSSFSFTASRKSRRASEEEIVYDTADRVRAEALKVLEMADGRTPQVRKTSTGGYTMDPEPRKRVPAKLAGIDYSSGVRSSQSSRGSHSSAQDRRWVIDSDVEDDDSDVVDVVKMQSTVGRQASSISDEDSGRSSWSSRYNVNHRLMAFTTGGITDTKSFLDTMDHNEQRRVETSARNMFRTSPHQSETVKLFGNGFTFRASNVFGKRDNADPKNVNLKTVWMDVDLQSNGRSLAPPVYRGPQTLEKARRRRRICVGVLVSVVLVVIIASVTGTKAGNRSSAAVIDENSVQFFVTADVPYDAGQESKIARDLETIPGEADFMIHLGNIQDASVSLCPQQAYISAKAILLKSRIPMFVLPGPNDSNNCPNPKYAFDDWTEQLGKFHQHFVHSFGVAHQLGSEENFFFLTKGVLIIGLHLVGGRNYDKQEWRIRLQKNVHWVEENLSRIPRDQYRALILLANARPSKQHDDFFSEIIDDINNVEKPVLYVHANAGSDKFETYTPFKEAKNLIAVQVPSGGANPPVSITVGTGDNPFVMSD